MYRMKLGISFSLGLLVYSAFLCGHSCVKLSSHDALTPEIKDSPKVIIVGAGLTGLSTAYHLKHYFGVSSVIIDERERVGGLVNTYQSSDGHQWEQGPNSFVTTPFLYHTIESLGLLPNLQIADDELPRFLLTGRSVHPLPLTLPQFLFSFSPIPFWERIKSIYRAFRRVERPSNWKESPTLGDFFDTVFGVAFTENLLQPFLSGVFAGDVYKLSADDAFHDLASNSLNRNFFSAIKNIGEKKNKHQKLLLDKFFPSKHQKYTLRPYQKFVGKLSNFDQGLSLLPQTLANAIGKENFILQTTVESIAFADNSFSLSLKKNDEISTLSGPYLSLSLPSYRIAKLLKASTDQELLVKDYLQTHDQLMDITYPPVFGVFISLPRSLNPRNSILCHKGRLQGFGILVRRSLSRSLYSSSVPTDLAVSPRAAEGDVDSSAEKKRTVEIRPESESGVLGIIFASSIFPNRSPKDKEVLVVFLGGARYGKEILQEIDEKANFQIDSRETVLRTTLVSRVERFFDKHRIFNRSHATTNESKKEDSEKSERETELGREEGKMAEGMKANDKLKKDERRRRDGEEGRGFKVLGVQEWQKAIPQYEVGHNERVQAIDSSIVLQEKLFFSGNWKNGISVNDCIENGALEAMRIYTEISKSPN